MYSDKIKNSKGQTYIIIKSEETTVNTLYLIKHGNKYYIADDNELEDLSLIDHKYIYTDKSTALETFDLEIGLF